MFDRRYMHGSKGSIFIFPVAHPYQQNSWVPHPQRALHLDSEPIQFGDMSFLSANAQLYTQSLNVLNVVHT